MQKKVAFITGITGQDGSYLTEHLLQKDYIVYGMIRRSSQFNTSRIEHLLPQIQLRYGDVLDLSNLMMILAEIVKLQLPIEIYHLAAQSHVKVSFEMPVYTAHCDALGTLNVLEAVRNLGVADCRIYIACTSELFGDVKEIPQSETTPFNPQSPYAVAKMFSFWISVNYRKAYGMYVSNGILFNHTSPRRGPTFVERKITMAVARIKHAFDNGRAPDPLVLGNLDAKRDIGHAKDYVAGMHLILQTDAPDDYVLATGQTFTVRDIVEKCFAIVNIPLVWDGDVGFDALTNTVLVTTDERYLRPSEVELLLGDASKAESSLKWTRTYRTIDDILAEMVAHDYEELKRGPK